MKMMSILRKARGELLLLVVMNKTLSRLFFILFGLVRIASLSMLRILARALPGIVPRRWGKVYLGRCDVKVPDNHQFGSTGRAFWKRWACFDFNDDHLTIEKIAASDSEENFWAELQMRFASNDAADCDALIFLHEYNNSFEDAVIRAAQIGVDLKVRGYTGVFSWPSKARAFKYATDAASIIASENAIADFLLNFIRRSGAKRVNIIAHSMGNRGLLAALQKISAKVALENSKVEFGQIILAAADLDAEVFLQAKVFILLFLVIR